MTCRPLTTPALVLLAALAAGPACFAEQYFYDAAGRLSAVLYDNGLQTTYTYDANDNLLSAETAAAPVVPDSKRFTTGAGGAASYAFPGTAAEANSGYGLLTTESGATPYGATLIRFTQGGVRVSEAGLPAVPPTARACIFIDRSGSGPALDTGVVLVNPSSSPTQLSLVLRDAFGSEVSRGTATLAAGAHVSYLLSGLQAFAPAFVSPTGSASPSIFSLEVDSDSPIAVSALRVATNHRGDILFSPALVADLAVTPSAGPVFVAHLADGGGFTTALHLMNPTELPLLGSIEFFNDEGSPLPVSTVSNGSAASFPYTIAPGGAFVLETTGGSPTATSGWARITPAGGAVVPAVAGIFRLSRDGIAISESNLPASQATTLARAYVDQSADRDTALVLANPGPETTVTLRAYGLDGVSPAAQPITVLLPAAGHQALVARAVLPDLPSGFKGVIEISSTSPVSALSIRWLNNERGDPVFTSLPVADMTRSAPSPVVFPHIVDGGGFQSEIILISPSDAVNVIRFLGPDGSPFEAVH